MCSIDVSVIVRNIVVYNTNDLTRVRLGVFLVVGLAFLKHLKKLAIKWMEWKFLLQLK